MFILVIVHTEKNSLSARIRAKDLIFNDVIENFHSSKTVGIHSNFVPRYLISVS
jgi:hypothetical protein